MANKLKQLILAFAVTNKLHLLETGVVTVKLNTGSLIPIGHGLLEHRVKLAEEGFPANEHVGLDIDSVHDASKLDSNVASTHDCNLRRQILHLKESVASDTVLRTGHGGMLGRPPVAKRICGAV